MRRSPSSFLAIAALAALGSAQVPQRIATRLAAPQADVKTPAPSLVAEADTSSTPRAPIAGPADLSVEREVQLAPLPLGVDFDVVRYQDGPDGALWARGADYKARFDSHSATVVPFFSSRAPRNFDLTFDLRSVTVAGRELALAPQAVVRRADDTVTLDHGDVDELYVLGQRGLEQKFVIDSLPSVGELVVRMGATTELEASASEDGFTFANEWGRVTYGRATAIDANGETLLLESRFVDGEIEIVAPADFIARAALPLVIDPVVWIFGVDVSANSAYSPDVSYDLSGGGVMHVYSVVFSANDWDVGSYATDRFGNVWNGSFGWTDFTSAHWTRPRIAHNGQTDRFLIVAQVGQPGAREVWGSVRSVWTNPISTPALMSGPEVGEKTNVDVGGDPYAFSPSYFLIVYERTLSATDHDIHARLVDINGVPLASPGTIFVDNTGATLDAYPSVSKSNGAGDWNLAWQRDVTGVATRVFGAKVLWNGSLTYSPFQISLGSQAHRRPSASSPIASSERFVVLCEKDYGTDNDIQAYGVNGNVVEQALNVSEQTPATLLRDQRDPTIDSDGAHFMTAFLELEPTLPNNYDIYATELQWSINGLGARENHMAVATTGAREGAPQLASAESSNPSQTTADYNVDYERGVGPGSGVTDDVFSALIAGSQGGEITSLCTRSQVACPCASAPGAGGCANSIGGLGATLSASGAARTTGDTLVLSTVGMPANATSLVFQGTDTLNFGFGVPVGDGIRCVGGFITRFAAHQNTAGGSTVSPAFGEFPISFQGAVPSMGGAFYYQTWYRDPANFCTSGVTNLSNALRVIWTP